MENGKVDADALAKHVSLAIAFLLYLYSNKAWVDIVFMILLIKKIINIMYTNTT